MGGEAMANLANKAIDTLIGSRRRMFGLSDLTKGVAAIGAKVKSANTALAKATGVNVANVAASVGCPAITAGISAQFPGIIIPACVTGWFSAKCKDVVIKAFKRQRLMRRLATLKRDIMNF